MDLDVLEELLFAQAPVIRTFRLQCGGRDAGAVTIDLRVLFETAVADGLNEHRAADNVAAIAAELQKGDQPVSWLDDLVRNAEIGRQLGFNKDRLVARLQEWDMVDLLRLPAVQFLLKAGVFKPSDADRVSRAIARGLRAKPVMFRGRKGRRKTIVDDESMNRAHRMLDEVTAAAALAKRATHSMPRRREALRAVIDRFLPNVDPRKRESIVNKHHLLSSREFAIRVTKAATGIAERRLRK